MSKLGIVIEPFLKEELELDPDKGIEDLIEKINNTIVARLLMKLEKEVSA